MSKKPQRQITDNKKVLFFVLSIMVISLVSCDSQNMDEVTPENPDPDSEIIEDLPPEDKVDSSLVGNWTQIYSPTLAFNIDSLGYVTYYRPNRLTGKLDLWEDRKDRIFAKDGKFKFLETQNCSPSRDSIYAFIGDTLSIPMQTNSYDLEKFVPIDNFESYTGRTRNASFVKASVENNTHAGASLVEFNASDAYDDIIVYGTDHYTSLTIVADPRFHCMVPLHSKNQLSLYIDSEITGPGTYEFSWGALVLAYYEVPYNYNLIYSAQENPILEGNLTIDTFENIGEKKFVTGTFKITFESEFQGQLYQTSVKEGSFEFFIDHADDWQGPMAQICKPCLLPS